MEPQQQTTPDRPQEYKPRALAHRAAAHLGRLGPGEMAELRRHRREDPPPPAYWRLWADLLEPHLPAPGERDHFERQWAAVFSVLARLHGLPGQAAPLGRALADADLSELRLNRLLRARGEALDDAIRTAASFLASKAVACDPGDIAALLLQQEGNAAERVRRGIARSYYQKKHSTEKES